MLINTYIFQNNIFNGYFGIKKIFFKYDVSFAVQCITTPKFSWFFFNLKGNRLSNFQPRIANVRHSAYYSNEFFIIISLKWVFNFKSQYIMTCIVKVRVLMFNATFKNISVISYEAVSFIGGGNRSIQR